VLSRSRARLAVVVPLTLAVLATVVPAALAAPPAKPAGLPSAAEVFQPYVGQSICDPVAKPGVRAFSNLVLDTYRDTSSLGIVRDCGIGGQSEHKEGRAWDWGVSAGNATHVREVNELLGWLMATDGYGNSNALLRRLGVMYVIWNKRIFKAYQADKGWQAYGGPNPHTDHVHFSFGWAGANKVTSFWDKTVAPVDYGPSAPKSVTPVATPANLPVLAQFGSTTLAAGSTGAAVTAYQKGLKKPQTASFDSDTQAAVSAFQRAQGLAVTGKVGPKDWAALFPKPTVPFGTFETADPALGQTLVTGWAIDAGDDVPLEIHVYVDGTYAARTVESQPRPDIAKTYVDYPAHHGFRLPLTLTDGPHEICAYALNAPGTAGANAKLGCLKTTGSHSPLGKLESVAQLPTGVLATGWALDPDVADPVALHVYLDGTLFKQVPAADVDRADVAARFPAYSSKHGFAIPLELQEGSHEVCVWAINQGGAPGSNTRLGCQTLQVRHTAVGVLDPLSTPPGAVVVSGAALDPDTDAGVHADVFVDGTFKVAVAADRARPAAPGYAAWGGNRGFRTALTLDAGKHTVCTWARNAPQTPGKDGLLGCKDVVVAHAPTGVQEKVAQGPTGTVVSGWGLDPDSTASTGVHVYVNGVKATEAVADLTRTDIAAKHTGQSPAHGYRVVLDLADGKHEVCTWVLNVAGTPGSNSRLPCTTVVIKHSPGGTAPVLGRRGSGVSLAGLAIDPDTTAPIGTHVYVNGKFVKAVQANTGRADGNTRYPGYGNAHGYSTVLELPAGTHKVCVYGLNTTGTAGKNALLGCSSINVQHTPFGNVSSVKVRKDGVAVTGWAIDPDTTGGVTVRIRVNGVTWTVLGAVVNRPDVGRLYPAYGPKHGFSSVLHLRKGKHSICGLADNVKNTPGSARGLGCATVTVR
jgi:peptidoglycan hydrolase-like protein with peptidoglycan-binding domain